MSHMHIPDGVLPVWLILLGWVLTGLALALVSWRLRRGDSARQLPLLGVMAAVMLVAMSLEVVPIAYHVNLSVLAGIVLGPPLGFLAAIVANLMLALFGHGGITVVGLNSLVLGAETILGYYLFRGLWSVLRRRQPSPALAAGAATVATLLVSTLLMVGIVALSNTDPVSRVGAVLEDLSFRNPFEHGLLVFESPEGNEEAAPTEPAPLDVATFARLVLLLGLAGWLLEAAITGAIVGFVYRVRPDLVVEGTSRWGDVPRNGRGSAGIQPASGQARPRAGGPPVDRAE